MKTCVKKATMTESNSIEYVTNHCVKKHVNEKSNKITWCKKASTTG